MALPGKKFLRGIVSNNEAGFTLVEMLVSISLTAVLLAVLSQFMYSGVRLWVKNDRAYQRQHQLRLIYQTLNNDLCSAFPGEFLKEPAVKGNEYQLSFWKETPDGLIKIQYLYQRGEKILLRSHGVWGSKLAEEQSILQEVVDCKFQYYSPEAETWLYDWDPEDNSDIPSLVRVSIRTKTGNLGAVTIPLKAWHQRGVK